MSMENENKEKNILTDEELKEVAGGDARSAYIVKCMGKLNAKNCLELPYCKWENSKCVVNF